MGRRSEVIGFDERGGRARREGGAREHRHQDQEPGPTKEARHQRVKRGSHDGDHTGPFIKARATRAREGKGARSVEGGFTDLRSSDTRAPPPAAKPAKLAAAVESRS